MQLVYGTDINPFRPGQWLAVYDASGAACVVQFKLGKLQVLDNKLGVLANMYYPSKDDYLVEQTQVHTAVYTVYA
jgi:penicillin V acylase-like amidase (Ntn superfamily)